MIIKQNTSQTHPETNTENLFEPNNTKVKMIARLFHNMRPSSAVVRLRVQGPLNSTSQFEINEKINRIQSFRNDALLVVINSYGGTLQSAKNISARLKKYSLNKKIPVYCFAEQFCLNSANLILTSGTKCFAHKFSTIGDFGFVYEGIDTQEFQKAYGIGKSHISSGKKTYDNSLFDKNAIPSDQELIKKVLSKSAQNLKGQIFQNRQNSLTKAQKQQFLQNLTKNEGLLEMEQGVDMGLIDGVIGIQEWMIENCKGKRVIQGTGFEFTNHPTIERLRSLRKTIKYN